MDTLTVLATATVLGVPSGQGSDTLPRCPGPRVTAVPGPAPCARGAQRAGLRHPPSVPRPQGDLCPRPCALCGRTAQPVHGLWPPGAVLTRLQPPALSPLVYSVSPALRPVWALSPALRLVWTRSPACPRSPGPRGLSSHASSHQHSHL